MRSNATEIAALYRRWALADARGASATYERLALAVSEEPAALALLERLEPVKRQPNLLFGALRWLDIPLEDPDEALAALLAQRERVLEVMLGRRTQTNEVARCATLLPALARLPGPLALIEVGASAGLCLLYDQWSYRYTGDGVDHRIVPGQDRVAIDCAVAGPVPLPERVPQIVWRAGLDLAPIDPADRDARRWLECLVWPEHLDRAARLHTALDIAVETGPRVHAGDLVLDLPPLLEQAPADATVVVLHSSTLAYVERPERDAFVATIARFGAHRLGAERPQVLPWLDAQIPAAITTEGRVIVSLDDDVLGVADRHGRTLEWLEGATAP